MLARREAGGLVDVRSGIRYVAADAVKVAGQCREAHDRAVGIKAVDVVHECGRGIVRASRAVRGIELRGLENEIRIQASDLRDLFQRVLINELFVFIKAERILLDVLLIHPAVVDDELAHAERESAVRAGVNLEENIRKVLRGRRISNVNDDDLAAACLEFLYTSNRKVIGVIPVVVPRKIGAGVTDVRTTAAASRCFITQELCRHAGAVVGGEVHAAEHMRHAVQDRAVPFAVAAEEHNGARTVLFPDLQQVLRDHVERFVPADGLKLALAALAHTLERRLQTIRAVHVVAQRRALRAELAVVERMLRRSFDPDDFSVLYIAVHAAVQAGTADRAQRALYFNAGILAGDLGFYFLFQFSQGSALLRNQ